MTRNVRFVKATIRLKRIILREQFYYVFEYKMFRASGRFPLSSNMVYLLDKIDVLYLVDKHY